METVGGALNMLTRVFNSLDVTILTFDSSRTVIWSNNSGAGFHAGVSEVGTTLGAAESDHFKNNEYFDENGTSLHYPRGSVIDRALEGKETHNLIIEHRNKAARSQRWLSISCVPVMSDRGEFEYGILWYRDISRRKLREHKLKFLQEATKTLSLTSDFEKRLQEKAKLAVPTLADWCSIDIAEGEETLRRVALVYSDSIKAEQIKKYEELYVSSDTAQSLRARVLKTGKAVFVPFLTDEVLAQNLSDKEQREALKDVGVSSIIVVPIKSGRRCLGVITFMHAESGRIYSDEDFQFMQEYSHHVCVLLETARLYDELSQRDRSKDAFLALLSHELRNPLAPIISGLELLRLKNTNSEIDEELYLIRHQFDHMAHLLNDLLDVTRFTRGKIELEFEAIELTSLVKRVVTISLPLIEKAGIALITQFPEVPMYYSGDPTRLEQAFHNLLSNALKFTPRGGTVTIELAESLTGVTFTLSDTGKGITGEEIEKIFEPYYQSSRTSQSTGLGVGLMLVREIIRLHGGTVSVKSAGAQQGSTFSVELPYTTKEIRHAERVTLPTAKENGVKRVLVVDDNEAAAEALVKLLQALNFTAHGVYSAKDALSYLENEETDLIFLDIGMPEMNGYELAYYLRQNGHRTLPVIALSGYGMEEDKRKSKEAGFTTHLTKPISAKDLRLVLTANYAQEVTT